MAAPLPSLVVFLFLLALAPDAGAAQTVLVELEISESTGGLIEDRFRSAIGDLAGVEVAASDARAHYVITAVVLCVPESRTCDDADSFNASVILSEPLTGSHLGRGLGRTGETVLRGWEPTPEAEGFLHRFRTMHSVWATSWDAESYGEEVDRLVRGIDARCFQQRRVVETRRRSLLQRGDTAAVENMPLELDPTGRSLC